MALVEIGGVPDVAPVLGIAETTVRTHLRHLFEKTGTSRQADLVKVVASFANPLIKLRASSFVVVGLPPLRERGRGTRGVTGER